MSYIHAVQCDGCRTIVYIVPLDWLVVGETHWCPRDDCRYKMRVHIDDKARWQEPSDG